MPAGREQRRQDEMWSWLKSIGAKLGNGFKGFGTRLYESARRAAPDDVQAWLEEKRELVALGEVYKGLQGNAGWQEHRERLSRFKASLVDQLVNAVLDRDCNEDLRRLRTTKLAAEIVSIDTFIGGPTTYVRDGEEARAELEKFQKAGGE